MIGASAPGSLMLLGEHAVLAGHPALVMGHTQRLSVTLTFGGDGRYVLSDRYGCADLEDPKMPSEFSFARTVCNLFRAQFPGPLTLQISSEFEDTLGFGSSGALIIAALGTFWKAQNPSQSFPKEARHTLLNQGRQVLQEVQGLGSGADLAASLWGGVRFYDPTQNLCEPLPKDLPLVAVYSGAKRKTRDVVSYANDRMHPFPHIRTSLFQVSHQIVLAGREALQKHDFEKFGTVCDVYQGLMESLGVNTPLLQELVDRLRSCQGIRGAKISGSGMGDCVIGVGTLTSQEMQAFNPYPVFPIHIAKEGLVFDTP